MGYKMSIIALQPITGWDCTPAGQINGEEAWQCSPSDEYIRDRAYFRDVTQTPPNQDPVSYWLRAELDFIEARGNDLPPLLGGDKPKSFKLGRRKKVVDARTLKFGDYIKALAPPPAEVDWSDGVTEWGMMDNDTLGCCVIAYVGHAIQAWTVNVGKEVSVTDGDVLGKYEHWCGYNPDDPSTDQGCVILDVLKSWRKHGMAGHFITAFASIEEQNTTQIQQAIDLFGGISIGLNVPAYIMPDDAPPPTNWDVDQNADNSIIGGHCVLVVGYDSEKLTFVSWGALYTMTWAFWNAFVDEAYAVLSPDFLKNQVAPNGFDVEQLEEDLAAL